MVVSLDGSGVLVLPEPEGECPAGAQLTDPIPANIAMGSLAVGFETVADGFVNPLLGIAPAGDDRLFVLDQPGQITQPRRPENVGQRQLDPELPVNPGYQHRRPQRMPSQFKESIINANTIDINLQHLCKQPGQHSLNTITRRNIVSRRRDTRPRQCPVTR